MKKRSAVKARRVNVFRRSVEFCGIYILIPILMRLEVLPGNPLVALFPMFLLTLFLLRADHSFDRSSLLNVRGAAENLKRVALLAALLLPVLLLLTFLFVPEQFLAFPRERPLAWLMVIFLYPLLSVYPQEIIFRAFLFHRYSCIFRTTPARVLASALTFGFVHIIFGNWPAVILSSLGGVLFALSYARSRSLLLASIEHAIYGDAVFTFGLGRFFYHAIFRL